MTPDLGSHSASSRAQRALARAAGDRRILAGAAATVGAAVAAGVARELVAGRDCGDKEATESHAYRIKREETAAEAIGRIARGSESAYTQIPRRTSSDACEPTGAPGGRIS
jgi:hypothetical protein